ncbi:MAG: MFS transporter [Rudaea sp.]|nr:MFS transporter [Rudaea sp.]
MPRWYHGWTIVMICVLVQSVTLGLPINCFSLFLPYWSKQFGVPISFLALGITIFSLVCGVLGPCAGSLADRVPARRLFACSLGALALFHLAITHAQSGLQILLLYAIPLPFIVIFGSSVTSQPLVSRWFERKSGLALGISAFGLAAAGVVFPPIVVRLIPFVQWQGVWMIVAGLIALIVLPLALVLVRDRPGVTDGAAYRAATAIDAAESARPGFGAVMKRRNFQILVMAFFPLQAMHMGVVVNLVPLAISRGFTSVASGQFLSVVAVAALLSKLGSGLLADRFGVRLPVLGVALLSATGALCIAFAGHNLVLMCAGAFLAGLNGGMWTLVAAGVLREFGSHAFGRAFGAASIFGAVSGALAPPIVARLQELSGTYVPGLIGLAVFILIGASQTLRLSDEHRKPYGK